MRKLFLEEVKSDKIILTGEDHNHLAFSLRSRVGDELTIVSGGIDYIAEITKITKSETIAVIKEKRRNISEPETQVTLFFGTMKGDRNDFVVQKCTELGVKKMVPFISDYSSVRAEAIKSERLCKIAKEAAKQSGRGQIPCVNKVSALNDLYDELSEYDLVIFPYERESERTLRSVFSRKTDYKNIAIVIGSEGGFSEEEANCIIEGGASCVTLGERILRAETACVAVTAVVMYEMDEWRRME